MTRGFFPPWKTSQNYRPFYLPQNSCFPGSLGAPQRGFTVVVKKNGRVGQRIAGTPPLPLFSQQMEGDECVGFFF